MGYVTSKGYGSHDGEMQRLFKAVAGEAIDSVHFGRDDNGLDCVFYGATASTYTWWDESADTWNFGQDDYGPDVYFYGATASAYMMWDASANALKTSGVARLELSGVKTAITTDAGGVIQAGTSGTPLTSATNEQEFVSWYFESSAQSAYGLRIQMEKTSTTAGAPRAVTLRTILSHASGATPQGASSVDARVTLETGNTGISGEMHAMESQCRVDAESRSVQGTYAAHKFTNEFGTSNTMPPNDTFFLRFYDAGAVKTPLMFDFSGLSEGAANCIDADTTALDGIATTYKIRVKDPAGNVGYIPIMGGLT